MTIGIATSLYANYYNNQLMHLNLECVPIIICQSFSNKFAKIATKTLSGVIIIFLIMTGQISDQVDD